MKIKKGKVQILKPKGKVLNGTLQYNDCGPDRAGNLIGNGEVVINQFNIDTYKDQLKEIDTWLAFYINRMIGLISRFLDIDKEIEDFTGIKYTEDIEELELLKEFLIKLGMEDKDE